MAAWLLSACNHGEVDSDAALKKQAEDFAVAYFNYDYTKARQFVTPESEKWLRFAASNVTQEDIDLINAASETVAVAATDCCHQNDSMVCVRVIVYNAVLKDSLERSAHTASEAEFVLTLVNRDRAYLVKMEGLPRNEKQSHGSASDE